MALEDFTTYTEVDGTGKLTVTAPKITAANLLRNADNYVYKDFGANYFDYIDLDFEIYCSSVSTTQGIGAVGFTQNTVNDRSQWANGDISIVSYSISPPNLQMNETGQAGDTSVNLSFNTLYYCTLRRAAGATAVNLYIYSDSARTTLVDTVTITLSSATLKYRYLYGLTSHNSATTNRWDGYVQNMEIRYPTTWIAMF